VFIFFMVNSIILTICTLNISWKTLSKAKKHTENSVKHMFYVFCAAVGFAGLM
jgi:hypothetical protein